MSQQINLFNPIFLKQKKYFSATTMAQALALVLFGALLLAGYARYQSYLLNKEATATAAQLAQAQVQLAQVSAQFTPRQKSALLEAEIRAADLEVTALRQAFDTLQKGELGNTAGYSEYLRAFSRQILPGIWLTGFTVHGAGSEIALQGRALQPELVPVYLGRLKREPVMQGKSFSALEMQRPDIEKETVIGNEATRQRIAAGYVDFRLQSSGIAEQGASGVKAK